MDWYYVASNERVGPINQTDFDSLVRSGTITPDTQVWREGMANWQRYGEVSGGLRLAPTPAESAGPGETTAGPVAGTVCSECGQTFPNDEVIRYGTVAVCAGCKPVFVQKLREGVVQPVGLEYAGFWIRFAAVFVDGIILWFVNFIIGMAVLVPLRGVTQPEENMGSFMAVQGVLLLIQLAIGIAYEVWFIGKFGATPGKMACKIKVVTPDGGPVTYARATGRYFAKLLSGLILLIGYIMAAFDPERRALHDRICDTRVIKIR